MIMTINKLEEQIRRILGQAETEDKAVSMLLTLLQPKITSTDIESLKKDYEEYFCNGTTVEELEMEEDGDDLTAVYVWRWFESRLSNKSELKKEAVCSICNRPTDKLNSDGVCGDCL